MTPYLHLIFVVSCVAYAIGNYLDYQNSLGRFELNPNYKDELGCFDRVKFRRSKVKEFLIIAAIIVVSEFALSRVTPHYAYAVVTPSAWFLFAGVRGMVLSRR